MKGRKRKPEALVAIEGRRSHLTKAEIESRKGPGFTASYDVEPPTHLVPLAREMWDRMVSELVNVGAMKIPTRFALEGACIAYAHAVAADKVIAEKGFTVEMFEDREGDLFCTGIKVRPEVKISHDCWARFRSFCTEFGMTPASEGKLNAPAGPRADPLDAALCG